MGFYQMKKLLCKGNTKRNNRVKRQNKMKEKMPASHTSDRDVISRIYKELQNLIAKVQITKTGNRDVNRHFLKEDIQMVNRLRKRC
jgi:hypothetical protein